MNTTHALILSHGLLLTGLLVLLALLRQCARQARMATTKSADRLTQMQRLRDTLHQWLVDGSPSDTLALQQAIEQTSALHSCWLACAHTVVTEAQLAHLPFSAEPHLASMALQSRKAVHQHQLAQWGWASTYIPVCNHGVPHGLLLLASSTALSVDDHAFAAATAEILCNAWSHAPHPSGRSAAITSP